MKYWCLMVAVLAGSIFASPLATGGDVYNASAEMAMSDAIIENWLNVETNAGTLFEENISISGFATREPVLLTWEMFDSRGEDVIDFNTGSLVNSSEGQHSTFTKVEDAKWNWTINIQRYDSLSCLCIIEFIGLGEDGSTARSATTLFTESSDGSLEPMGILFSPEVHDVADDMIHFEGIISDDGGTEQEIFLEAILCMQADCALWQNWNNSGQLSTLNALPVTVEDWNEDNGFSATLQLDDPLIQHWEDGIWIGCLIPYDAAVNQGQPIWFRVSINRAAPIASLMGPESVNESTMTAIDGTGSIDPGWGWEGLHYVWTIHRGDEVRVPYEWEQEEQGILILDTNSSGDYIIHLTVIDIGGKMNSTSHSISVINRVPILELRLESVALDDSETIRLPNADSWIFDSSNSYDDELFNGGLSRTWLLDGESIGNTALLTVKREQITGEHNLTLILTDDDGSSSSISLQLVVAGSSEDPHMAQMDGDEISWMPIIIAIILILIAMWVVNDQMHKEDRELSINVLPSWKNQKGKESGKGKDEEDSSDSDA
ncbi:MAG: hypothetical protein NZ770_01950 [Candidatus Poseidoniaceae archaeon]|nr:hypothetical protein [Candidatus Poseidoniaceae archaeon]